MYRLLKEYKNKRILSILFAKLLLGKKVKLIVDGTILKVAKPKQGKDSEHYKEKVRFEELYYKVSELTYNFCVWT